MNQILKHRFTQISRQNNYLFTIRQTPELNSSTPTTENTTSRIVVLREAESVRFPVTESLGYIKARHSDV